MWCESTIDSTVRSLVLLHGGGGGSNISDLALVLVINLALLALDQVLAVLVEVELGDNEIGGVKRDLDGGAFKQKLVDVRC